MHGCGRVSGQDDSSGFHHSRRGPPLREFRHPPRSGHVEGQGFVPIFDCGASLGFKTSTVWINEGYDLTSKSFKITHSEQIRLVHSFDWMGLSRLDGIEETVEVFDRPCSAIERNRAETIAQYLRRRIEKLKGVSVGYAGFYDNPHGSSSVL